MNSPTPPPKLGPSPVAAGDLQLSVAEATATLTEAMQAARALRLLQRPAERVPLRQALMRVLAEDQHSPIDVPAHDNSAMDGYAFAGAALQPGQPTTLAVLPGVTVLAGQRHPGGLAPGQALRIMTGAPMPDGLDTVVPLELCRLSADGQTLDIAADALRPGENRRKAGEDLARGSVAVAAGRVLRPVDLGLLASLGQTEVPVRPRLKVAVLSTGDEIVAPGSARPDGAIYDSNRSTLCAALERLGMEALDCGLVPDRPDALRQALSAAAQQADAVLTSGGVSAGDADYVRDVLAELGEVGFWKVAMRPGRPFAFGPLRGARPQSPSWLFALPGNPVAALVTFYVLVQDALWRLAGAEPPQRTALQVPVAEAIRKRPGRSEYQRAVIEPGPDGLPRVRSAGTQGAGVLSSMSRANALIVLDHDQGSVAAGGSVTVWPFDGLV